MLQPRMSEAITQLRSSFTGTHCLTVKTLSSSCCIDSRSCTNTIYMYSRMLVSSLNYRPRLSKQPTQSMWKSFESKICTKSGVTSAGSDPDSHGLRSHMHIILYWADKHIYRSNMIVYYSCLCNHKPCSRFSPSSAISSFPSGVVLKGLATTFFRLISEGLVAACRERGGKVQWITAYKL